MEGGHPENEYVIYHHELPEEAIAAIQERCGFYNYDLMQKAQNLDSDRA